MYSHCLSGALETQADEIISMTGVSWSMLSQHDSKYVRRSRWGQLIHHRYHCACACAYTANTCVLVGHVCACTCLVHTPWSLFVAFYPSYSPDCFRVSHGNGAKSPYFGFEINEDAKHLDDKSVYCCSCYHRVSYTYSGNATNLEQHLHAKVLGDVKVS